MGTGIVYVVHNDWIQNPEAVEGFMTYKIGITADSVSNRYYGLGLKMPSEFECDFAYEFDSERHKEVETALHKLLNQSNVGGEWFDLSDDTLDGVRSICELAGGILITDTVEKEIEADAGPVVVVTREDWINKSGCTVETADSLYALVSGVFQKPGLNYTKKYIAVTSSNANCFWLGKRSQKMPSILYFYVNEEKRDGLVEFLKEKNIQWRSSGRGWGGIYVDKQFVEQHEEVFIKIAEFVKGFKER